MLWGTTFSTKHVLERGGDIWSCYRAIQSLGFGCLRIPVYWSDIESTQGVYTWDMLDRLCELTLRDNQQILLTVGMKSPRWPEFHLPGWASDQDGFADACLRYVDAVVSRYRSLSNLIAWQVENEAFDPSGPDGRVLSPTFLDRGIASIRELDSRPLLFTVWGNTLRKRGILSRIPNGIDWIGVDVYYKVPRAFGFGYTKPDEDEKTIARLLANTGKRFFITELQAEPWEHNRQKDKTPSMSPLQLKTNCERARNVNSSGIFLWGAEYWYRQMQQGDRSYMDVVREIIQG